MRQVLRAGALGRPRGMGWGGRWEGGSGWGTHVNPWLIHVNVWQKPLQYCKVISLQLRKINEKLKKKHTTVRTGHGTMHCFQIGKGLCQGCIFSSYLFNLYAEYIMQNAGLDEAQEGIKIAKRNINNLRYADEHHPYGRK